MKDQISSKAVQGVLDGLTIARFAHGFRREHAGGVERYLADLNAQLLQRNRMVILQVYLAEGGQKPEVEVINSGRGRLVLIPSPHAKDDSTGKFSVCHDLFLSTFADHKVDLAVFHWVSYDSSRVVRYFTEHKVPYVLINHFNNKRFWKWFLRKEFIGARAVAGVSAMNLPWFLKPRFTNVSDGVDTEFFRYRAINRSVQKIPDGLILLVARITSGKGHMEAIRAQELLFQRGLKPELAFIGESDSPALTARLLDEAEHRGVSDRVTFVGELSPERLRDWYSACDVVILPSQSEGLGRVLLEAQAMGKPVVAYSAGGMKGAVKDRETGFLVPTGDVSAMASKIGLLLEDPSLRMAMGKRGREFVEEHFSLTTLAERHERFYLSALDVAKQ